MAIDTVETEAEATFWQAIHALAVALFGPDADEDDEVYASDIVVMGNLEGIEGPEYEAALAAWDAWEPEWRAQHE